MMDENNRKDLEAVLKDIVESSTIHGLPKVLSSRQIPVKILWCFLFLSASVLCGIQIYGLFKEYNSNPKQTIYSIESGEMKFPAITICNMNVVKSSKVHLHEQLHELANPVDAIQMMQIENVFVSVRSTDILEWVLKGFVISEEDLLNFYPGLSYWGKVDRLRNVYFKYNPTKERMDAESKLLSEEEVLKLLEDQLYPSTVEHSSTDFSSSTPITADVSTASVDLDTQPQSGDNERDKRSFTWTPTSSMYSSEASTTPYLLNPTIENNETIVYYTVDVHEPMYMPDLDPVMITMGKDISSSQQVYRKYFKEVLQGPEFQRPLNMWIARKKLFAAITRQQVGSLRRRLGHRIEDVVISSYFKEFPKNITFHYSWTKEYGNCYTIDSPEYKSRRSGPDNGFDLLLNLEMDDYIPSVQESQGIRIVLHEQGTIPFPTTEGLTLGPGYEHTIGLKMEQSSILGSPYGNCTDGELFKKKYGKAYSQKACTEICRIDYYIRECGCMPYDAAEILEKYIDLPVCKFAENLSECENTIIQDVDKQVDICNCEEPCSKTTYLKTISGRQWPTDNYLLNVTMDSLCDFHGTMAQSMLKMCHAYWNKRLDTQKYRNNFMLIHIYFEDSQYRKFREDPTYGVIRFLSDIGGTVGLFIGASALSIVEILQILLEIVLHLRKGKRSGSHNDLDIENTSNRPSSVIRSDVYRSSEFIPSGELV